LCPTRAWELVYVADRRKTRTVRNAAMKKNLSSLIILLLFLVPALGNASYLIRLKNGGQLTTPAYWTEGQWIFFYCVGGIAGMERREIDRIERDKTYDNLGTVGRDIEKKAPPPPPKTEKPQEPGKLPAEAKPKAEEILSPQGPREKIDLKAYQDKMATLKADINKTLTRIRKASASKDMDEKEAATEDNRRISAEMWKLTDELEKKNNGKLPADWWEEVGRKEPATP